MRIALVGCGYVADFYARTIPNHRSLEIAAVMDRDEARAQARPDRRLAPLGMLQQRGDVIIHAVRGESDLALHARHGPEQEVRK